MEADIQYTRSNNSVEVCTSDVAYLDLASSSSVIFPLATSPNSFITAGSS